MESKQVELQQFELLPVPNAYVSDLIVLSFSAKTSFRLPFRPETFSDESLQLSLKRFVAGSMVVWRSLCLLLLGLSLVHVALGLVSSLSLGRRGVEGQNCVVDDRSAQARRATIPMLGASVANAQSNKRSNDDDDDDIAIEPYHCSGEGKAHLDIQIRRLFREGILSLVNDAYHRVLWRSKAGWTTLGLSAGVFFGALVGGCPPSRVGPIALAGIPCGVLYMWIRHNFGRYVQTSLQDDLSDIERIYGSKSRGIFLIAKSRTSNELVGMVGGERKQDETIELRRMSVKSTARGRRVGTRLVEALMDYCHQEGCRRVFLSCTSIQYAAQALYRKNGFELKRQFPMFLGDAIRICMFEKNLSLE